MLGWLSTGDASVVVAIIVAASALVAGRSRKEIQQINRAVNHQAAGEPTLIERMIRLEQNQQVHTTWVTNVLQRLAVQVGINVPPPPPSEPLQ